MRAVGADDYQRYMAVLEANPGEFAELFDTILINVTSLLRDRDAWELLATSVLPNLLETINSELRLRSVELDELNTFLESILASLRSAVVVLGPEMEVRAWNRQAEDLWGLRAEEVNTQHFLNLDIGFPVESLGHAIRACLAGRSDGDRVTQVAVNRRGRTIERTVTVSRLVSEEVVRGVILLMEAQPLGEDSAHGGETAAER